MEFRIVNLIAWLSFLMLMFAACSEEQSEEIQQNSRNLQTKTSFECQLQSQEYLNFEIARDSYQKEFFAVMDLLSLQEKAVLYANLENDDFLFQFMEQYNLLVGNRK